MITAKEDVSESEHGSVGTIEKRNMLKGREEKRQAWKRDLSGRANGTIDPFYGCFLLSEVTDYAQNFSFPWSEYAAHFLANLT